MEIDKCSYGDPMNDDTERSMPFMSTNNWINWTAMHALVIPSALDSVDRAMIAAAQQPANANRPARRP